MSNPNYQDEEETLRQNIKDTTGEDPEDVLGPGWYEDWAEENYK